MRLPWRRRSRPPRVTAGPTTAASPSCSAAADPAVADSAVLATAGVAEGRPVLVRHHLLLPPDRLAEAAGLLAEEGYALRSDRPRCPVAWSPPGPRASSR